MSYKFQGTLYRTADARDAAIAYANMTANGLNSWRTINGFILDGLTPEAAADDAIAGWDLLATYDEDGSDWRGSKEGQPVHEGLTRKSLIAAHRDFFEERPDMPDDDAFVTCETVDGYSLHAPDSMDEEIADGSAPALTSGAWPDDAREIPAAAYDAARKALRSVR
jgi:hypothetical protein